MVCDADRADIEVEEWFHSDRPDAVLVLCLENEPFSASLLTGAPAAQLFTQAVCDFGICCAEIARQTDGRSAHIDLTGRTQRPLTETRVVAYGARRAYRCQRTDLLT